MAICTIIIFYKRQSIEIWKMFEMNEVYPNILIQRKMKRVIMRIIITLYRRCRLASSVKVKRQIRDLHLETLGDTHIGKL